MKKRLYYVNNNLYYVDPTNDVFEVNVDSIEDYNRLKEFASNDPSPCINGIPELFYDDEHEIPWSSIEVHGRKPLISQLIPSIPINYADDSSDTSIVLYIDYFESVDLLREINQTCIRQNKRLLPFILSENKLVIGPYVIPGQSSCYECKTQRLINNGFFDRESALILEEIFSHSEHKSCSQMNVDFARAMLIKAVHMIVNDDKNIFINSEIEIDLIGLTTKIHSILPWPACDCRELKWIY